MSVRRARRPALARHWQRWLRQGSSAARDQLIVHYSPLVKFVVGRLGIGTHPTVDTGDLINHGIFGLIDAIERFDPDRGVKFETFAVPRIRRAVYDGLRQLDWVPRSVRSRARQIEAAIASFEARHGRAPDDAELAGALDLDVEQLTEWMSSVASTAIGPLDRAIEAGHEPVALDGDVRCHPLASSKSARYAERCAASCAGSPNARSSCSASTTTRAHSRPDRRCARRHRESGLADPRQGGAPPSRTAHVCRHRLNSGHSSERSDIPMGSCSVARLLAGSPRARLPRHTRRCTASSTRSGRRRACGAPATAASSSVRRQDSRSCRCAGHGQVQRRRRRDHLRRRRPSRRHADHLWWARVDRRAAWSVRRARRRHRQRRTDPALRLAATRPGSYLDPTPVLGSLRIRPYLVPTDGTAPRSAEHGGVCAR